MKTKMHLLGLIVVTLLALAIRIHVGEVQKPLPPHGGMTRAYFNYAANLLEHGTYSRFQSDDPQPDSLRTPIYPLFLAAVRIVSGETRWERAVSWSQYFIGALICLLIALLGRKLAGDAVGLIAGTLAAFYVDYHYLTIIFLRETLSLFNVLLFFLAYLEFRDTRKNAWGYASAALFGAGILNRPEMLLIGFFLFALDYKRLTGLFPKNGAAPRLLIILLLALSPWMTWIARNGAVHGHFMPFSSDSAWTLFMGQVYSPDETYSIADPTALKIIEATPMEYDWYQYMNRASRRAFVENPLRNTLWSVEKLRQTFLEYTDKKMSLFYPLLWVALPFFSFKNKNHRLELTLLGILAAIFHLKVGGWDPQHPALLLHIKFSDIIFPGAAGFAILVLKDKKSRWPILAASFLTLIATVAVYIAHLRARLVFCDWILMIGTAYAVVELTRFLRDTRVVGKVKQEPAVV